MEKQNKNERPEVYALRQDGGNWQISRRDFLKAAGIGAAAVTAGLNSGCSRRNNVWKGETESLDVLCPQIPTHKYIITQLLVTDDGKYLVSNDRHYVKCWDFNTSALLQKYNLNADKIILGKIGGKNSVINSSRDPSSATASYFYCCHIPDEPKSADNLHARISGFYKDFAIDASENIYTVDAESIRILKKAGTGKESAYEQEEILFTFGNREGNPSCTLMKDGREMFIRMNEGFGILDLETRELKQFEGGCTCYAIDQDSSKVLIFSELEYRLVSLDNGETIWSRTVNDLHDDEGGDLFVPRRVSGGSYVLCKTGITPDGSMGILLGEKAVCLISMSDGALLRYRSINGDPDDGVGCVAMSKDGKKAAVSVSKAILFLSLPDLEIFSCPIDLSEVKDDVNGIEISVKDPDSGKKIKYTLPCGAAVPEGAVCTCNCVSGRGGCSCDSHGKSNGNGRSNSGRHYWHPN